MARKESERGLVPIKNPKALANTVSRTAAARARRWKQGRFLYAYRKPSVLSTLEASKMAGLSERTVEKWLENDPLFIEHFLELEKLKHKQKAAKLEKELYRRAVDGVDQPLVSMGKVVTTVKRYSDKLLELALRGEIPEKYGTKHQGANVEVGTDKDGNKFIKAYVGFDPDEAV